MRETLYEYCHRTDQLRLLDDWDAEKNAPLTPDNTTRGSKRKVWWCCQKGHSWQAPIYTRTEGCGCPYCAGKRADESNSLAVCHPELAKSWDVEKNAPLTPGDVLSGSHRKVWWKCEKGHSFRTQIQVRTQGSGCPYCMNRKIVEENSLAITNPELAEEWDSLRNGTLKPTQVVGGAKKRAWWRCKRGHSWPIILFTKK